MVLLIWMLILSIELITLKFLYIYLYGTAFARVCM